jgi:hypothetical protein
LNQKDALKISAFIGFITGAVYGTFAYVPKKFIANATFKTHGILYPFYNAGTIVYGWLVNALGYISSAIYHGLIGLLISVGIAIIAMLAYQGNSSNASQPIYAPRVNEMVRSLSQPTMQDRRVNEVIRKLIQAENE